MQIRPERILDARTNVYGPSLPSGIEGRVVYWMNRDQRVEHNWALLYAQSLSDEIVVVVTVDEEFIGPTERHRAFMLNGLYEVHNQLSILNIPLIILEGATESVLPSQLEKLDAKVLITDFEPLRRTQRMHQVLITSTTIPFHVVDAHNIVPTWIASNKREFAAYTIRPKLTRNLATYLEPFPKIMPQATPALQSPKPTLAFVKEATTVTSGFTCGMRRVDEFIDDLSVYSQRNDPNVPAQSDLSPYLHFGHISAQEVALRVLQKEGLLADSIIDIRQVAHGFLEELIIRRELSDNFTYYNADYDSFNGLPAWAKTTLDEHRADKRDFVYTFEQWNGAGTHDELWNAAQKQMMSAGKMHGYMRMYWAKKILEWSATPEEAMATAIALNDLYSLDGSDPNGYTGIAWSVGGVHDRAWGERPVFGKIRYMNAAGCKRKFDVATYIRTYDTE